MPATADRTAGTLATRQRALMVPGLLCCAQASYAFMSTLVQEVIYRWLPERQRRDLHGKAATYMAQRRAADTRQVGAISRPSPGHLPPSPGHLPPSPDMSCSSGMLVQVVHPTSGAKVRTCKGSPTPD